MIDRSAFFDSVRASLFAGRLSTPQVNGMTDLLDYWEAVHGVEDLRWLAYILATAYHETGAKMLPVREGFAKTDTRAREIVARRAYGKVGRYGFVPYGRGRVQVTWDDNYARLETIFHVPLTREPDLLLDSKLDAKITVESCIMGLYTGKRLADYFEGSMEFPRAARKIINGMDRADLVASYYEKFALALGAKRGEVIK